MLVRIECPYCGKPNDIDVDELDEPQEYVEDCRVCCNPVALRVTPEDGEPRVEARRQDD